jgi:hypothetical protein
MSWIVVVDIVKELVARACLRFMSFVEGFIVGLVAPALIISTCRLLINRL